MKKFKVILSVAMMVMLISITALLVGCFGDTSSDSTGFTISKSEIALSQIGETVTLEAKNDGSSVDATWSVDDETIVTVSSGVVTAVANGSAVVTATYGEEELTCAVTVDSDFAITVDFDGYILDMDVDDTYNLNPTVTLPDVTDTDDTYTISSSDETVATVTDDGVITALKSGITTISLETNLTKPVYTFGADGVGYYDQTETTSVVVAVGNEFANSNLVGSYGYSVEWLGFASSADAKAATEAPTQKIIANLTLTINEDGTFTQTITNAKRATAEYDSESETPYAGYYPFNASYQSSEELGDEYLDVAQSSMSAISQYGGIIVQGETVTFVMFGVTAGVVFSECSLANNEWMVEWSVFSDMVAVHSDMDGDLVKYPTYESMAGTYTYTSTMISYSFVLSEDGTFTYGYSSAMMGTDTVAEGIYTIDGLTLTFPCDSDDLTSMELVFDSNASTLSGTVATGGEGTQDYTFALVVDYN